MGQQIAGSWQEQRNNPERRKRQATALRQLEWAQTYLHAVEALELEDPEVRLLVSRAHQALVAVELRVRRLTAS
jgi:hypothetical protein